MSIFYRIPVTGFLLLVTAGTAFGANKETSKKETKTMTSEDTMVGVPYAVGPFPVWVFTDAKLFSTGLKINGSHVSMENGDGFGSMNVEGKSYRGTLGHSDKKLLNLYLRPGKNVIEIDFALSNIYKERVSDGALEEAHFAAYLVKAGETESNIEYSYTQEQLTSAFSQDNANFKTLMKESSRFGSTKPPQGTYHFKHELFVDASNGWKFKAADIKECEWEFSRPTQMLGSETIYTGSVVGKLLLNGKPVEQFMKDSWRPLAAFEPLNGQNEIVYQVASKGKHPEKLEITLECDMESALKEVTSPNLTKYKDKTGERFGSSKRKVLIWSVMIEKMGVYKGSFNFASSP